MNRSLNGMDNMMLIDDDFTIVDEKERENIYVVCYMKWIHLSDEVCRSGTIEMRWIRELRLCANTKCECVCVCVPLLECVSVCVYNSTWCIASPDYCCVWLTGDCNDICNGATRELTRLQLQKTTRCIYGLQGDDIACFQRRRLILPCLLLAHLPCVAVAACARYRCHEQQSSSNGSCSSMLSPLPLVLTFVLTCTHTNTRTSAHRNWQKTILSLASQPNPIAVVHWLDARRPGCAFDVTHTALNLCLVAQSRTNNSIFWGQFLKISRKQTTFYASLLIDRSIREKEELLRQHRSLSQ